MRLLVLVGVLHFCCGIAAAQPKDQPSSRVGVDGGLAIELVYIEPGTFTMGHNQRTERFFATTLGAMPIFSHLDEGPAHKVTISKGYYLGKYKVTVAQYCAFLNSLPAREASQFVTLNPFSSIEKNKESQYMPKKDCAKCAADTVPWKGAVAFCKWLSARSGRTVRLPTEAQWEFAARGPEGRRYPWGNQELRSEQWTFAIIHAPGKHIRVPVEEWNRLNNTSQDDVVHMPDDALRWINISQKWIRVPAEALSKLKTVEAAGRGGPRDSEAKWLFILGKWTDLPVDDPARAKNTTPDGLVGMADSVGEWVSDLYAEDYPKVDQIDPKGPAKSSWDRPPYNTPSRVLRGRRPWATSREAGLEAREDAGVYGFRILVEAPHERDHAKPTEHGVGAQSLPEVGDGLVTYTTFGEVLDANGSPGGSAPDAPRASSTPSPLTADRRIARVVLKP
jgi:formylglycine-generating enzyme required for sulfatase activity